MTAQTSPAHLPSGNIQASPPEPCSVLPGPALDTPPQQAQVSVVPAARVCLHETRGLEFEVGSIGGAFPAL